MHKCTSLMKRNDYDILYNLCKYIKLAIEKKKKGNTLRCI